MCLIWSSHHAGLTEGLKVASERLSWGFSCGAKALAGNRHAADSLTAKAKRALRAAPQVGACPRHPQCHAGNSKLGPHTRWLAGWRLII